MTLIHHPNPADLLLLMKNLAVHLVLDIPSLVGAMNQEINLY